MGDRRILIGLFAGAIVAPLLMGREALPWGLGLVGAVAALQLWELWRRRKEARSVVGALRAHWAEFTGGREIEGAVHLYDGDHPLAVRIGRDGATLTAGISAVVPEAPAAFRIWPSGSPPPEVAADGAPGGPAVERSAVLEQYLAGRLSLECNDEQLTGQMLDQEVLAALFAVQGELRDGFRGVTYDGRQVTVHLAGPVVTDPQRATQLARSIWRGFVP